MHFRFITIFYLAAASLLLSGCWRHDVSGKYIAKFTNGVYWLQLVETPDKHLTGQFDTLVLGSDGKIVYSNLSVTGAADGGNISMLLKPISFLPFTVTASGTLDGDQLTLTGGFTGGQPSTVVLVRSDASEYQAQVRILNAQSQAILVAKADAEARTKAARQEQDAITELNQLVNQMKHFNAAVDTHLSRLLAAEQRYHAITFKMQENLKRQGQLVSNPDASFKRGEMSFAISQGAFTTDQIHNDVQAVQRDFRTNAEPLMKQVTQSEQACHRAHSSTAGKPIPPEAEAWNSACLKLLDAVTLYRQKFDTVARTLVHLEEVYQQERKNQEQLVRESQQVQ